MRFAAPHFALVAHCFAKCLAMEPSRFDRGDEAANISGQCFAAYGYTYSLVSQSQVIKTLRSETGWTVDSLAEILPKTFGENLKSPVWHEDGSLEQTGLNLHRQDLPDSAWVEVGSGVKFWMIPLPPYGETR